MGQKHPDSPFGRALRKLLLERGLTQRQLAAKSFVHRTTLNQIMKGQREANPATRDHIFSIFKALSEDELLSEATMNELLGTIPKMSKLDRRSADDLKFLHELEKIKQNKATSTSKKEKGEPTWQPNAEREALEKIAWDLYIELGNRSTIQSLPATHGLLSAALTSIFTFAKKAQQIIHDAGPKTAAPITELSGKSLSDMVIQLLIKDIKSFTDKWHTWLSDYEEVRPAGKSQYTYEQEWEKAQEMRNDLATLQKKARGYLDTFAQIAGADRRLARTEWTVKDYAILKETAWHFYTELRTKIIPQPDPPEYSLLANELHSLHTFFVETRQILHDIGPRVGFMVVAQDGRTFSAIVMQLLANIRPFTAKWHGFFTDYAEAHPAGKSQYAHEQEWERAEEMRNDLAQLRKGLEIYIGIFADLSGI
jgi:transcriptional regulator with XRE-family HTH domain